MSDKEHYFKFNSKNTFCISVLTNTERWSRMEQRFNELNMSVTRFQASTPDDILKNKNNNLFASQLNIGQKCCALSHFRLWEQIFLSGLEYALIIEDDARFDKDWIHKLQIITRIIDGDWDAIFLNCSEPIDPAFTWKKINEQYLTGAYIISKKGVINVLKMYYHTICASDWMTSRLQDRGNCYSYFPWLVIQDGTESTIGSNFNADHQKVVLCLKNINYSLEGNYV